MWDIVAGVTSLVALPLTAGILIANSESLPDRERRLNDRLKGMEQGKSAAPYFAVRNVRVERGDSRWPKKTTGKWPFLIPDGDTIVRLTPKLDNELPGDTHPKDWRTAAEETARDVSSSGTYESFQASFYDSLPADEGMTPEIVLRLDTVHIETVERFLRILPSRLNRARK